MTKTCFSIPDGRSTIAISEETPESPKVELQWRLRQAVQSLKRTSRNTLGRAVKPISKRNSPNSVHHSPLCSAESPLYGWISILYFCLRGISFPHSSFQLHPLPLFCHHCANAFCYGKQLNGHIIQLFQLTLVRRQFSMCSSPVQFSKAACKSSKEFYNEARLFTQGIHHWQQIC